MPTFPIVQQVSACKRADLRSLFIIGLTWIGLSLSVVKPHAMCNRSINSTAAAGPDVFRYGGIRVRWPAAKSPKCVIEIYNNPIGFCCCLHLTILTLARGVWLSVPETPRAITCSSRFITWPETNECFTDFRPVGQVLFEFCFARFPTLFTRTYNQGYYRKTYGKYGNSLSIIKRVSIVR